VGSFEPYVVDYPHMPLFGQPEEPTTTSTFLGFEPRSLFEPGNKALNTGTGARAAVSVEKIPNAPAVTGENIELYTTEQTRAALEVALKSD
jgi:hypothetical protein